MSGVGTGDAVGNAIGTSGWPAKGGLATPTVGMEVEPVAVD